MKKILVETEAGSILYGRDAEETIDQEFGEVKCVGEGGGWKHLLAA